MAMNSLIKKMLDGDKRALARLMTYVDNRHDDLMDIMKFIYEKGKGSIKIGITGPPGAGKSTLVDKIIKEYRRQKNTVGVVAIDPSSPFTGGAVLGDRIRMTEHGGDDGVFIRSLGSRGSHGGLSRATRDIVKLMDAFGFDIIIVETVGVGQTELDIMDVADVTIVTLVPESGDTIQTMKAGLMEIADIFVVNKADREGADRIFAELRSLSEIHAGTSIPVLKVEAIRSVGVSELMDQIKMFLKKEKSGSHKNEDKILLEESLQILASEVCDYVSKKMKSSKELSNISKKLIEDHRNPYRAADDLYQAIMKK